MKIYYHLFL